MGGKSKAESLLRRTFGQTTPMQADERLMQQPQAWTQEELDAAGIPENLHSQASWWSSLEEMKEDLEISGPKLDE